MKLRKIVGLAGVALMGCGLAACSSAEVEVEPEIAFSVDSGTYIIPYGETPTPESGFLALDFTIKNLSDYKKNFSVEDFEMYDSEGEQADWFTAYGEGFEPFGGASLAAGKSLKSTLVFRVNKAEIYDLEFYSEDGDYESWEVDAGEYTDESGDVLALTNSYIDGVFLGKTPSAEATTKLVNDLNADRDVFKQGFAQALRGYFTYYQPNDDEANNIVNTFMQVNGERANINAVVTELYPTSAIVTVLPECLSFDNMNLVAVADKFWKENEDAYFDADKWESLNPDSDRAVIQQLPDIIRTSAVTKTQEGISGDMRLRLNKVGDQWEVVTADTDNNWEFFNLRQRLRGDLSL